MAAQLQKPPFVYLGGRYVSWEEATIHVGSEALLRSISVFEGLKAYWTHDNKTLNILALKEHYDRLVRSTILQYLPFSMGFEQFQEASIGLLKRLCKPEKDIWFRPTVFSVEGQWGENTITDLCITAYLQEKKKPEPFDVAFSSWQRPLDTSLPPRIKAAANYQIARMARIEGRRQGYADMIVLNSWGRVAEASASCVLMVREGKIITPPAWEGCLESITVNIVEALAKTLGIPFERRPIDRTELTVSDGICLAGTLMELGRVRRVEDHTLPASCPELERVTDEFWACMRGAKSHPAVKLTPV